MEIIPPPFSLIPRLGRRHRLVKHVHGTVSRWTACTRVKGEISGMRPPGKPRNRLSLAWTGGPCGWNMGNAWLRAYFDSTGIYFVLPFDQQTSTLICLLLGPLDYG